MPGDMGLSGHLEHILTERYGQQVPPPRRDGTSPKTPSWYCPGCGVLLDPELQCPQCQRSLKDLQHALIELHPHAKQPIDTRISDEWNLHLLQPEANEGYLPQPIPTARDAGIRALLSHLIENRSIAPFAHRLHDGEAAVLKVFAERMATLAVRAHDPTILHLGLVALLLSGSPSSDPRDRLTVFPLFCDAVSRLGIDQPAFIAALRSTIGDRLATPFLDFLNRDERNRSLKSMGYVEGADSDGFRYIRTW